MQDAGYGKSELICAREVQTETQTSRELETLWQINA